jgi:SAM-dependent methyltransferase
MFSLSETDLGKRILGCGDGPAAFNAGLTRRGGTVVSIDPIYRFTRQEIESRIAETCQKVLEQTRSNQEEFVWTYIKDVDELGRVRMAATQEFLRDYAKADGRYVAGELPALGFQDGDFDLALCSHFLFLYSEHFPADFHVQSIIDLCRVAGEVRIFPLLELGAKKSRHVDTVLERLADQGYQCAIETVPYEFQKGGNEMLRVVSPAGQKETG